MLLTCADVLNDAAASGHSSHGQSVTDSHTGDSVIGVSTAADSVTVSLPPPTVSVQRKRHSMALAVDADTQQDSSDEVCLSVTCSCVCVSLLVRLSHCCVFAQFLNLCVSLADLLSDFQRSYCSCKL